jgi:hypothetical protein
LIGLLLAHHAHSSCSLGIVFEQLRKDVEADVKVRQTIRPSMSHYGFNFLPASTKSFSVLMEGNRIHLTVDFTLNEGVIHVRGLGYDGAPNFDMTLTLNDEGECRAKINGQEKEFWQVRKMALETLFFESRP